MMMVYMVLILLELDLPYPVLSLADMPALGTVALSPAAAEKNGPGQGMHFDFIQLMDHACHHCIHVLWDHFALPSFEFWLKLHLVRSAGWRWLFSLLCSRFAGDVGT